MLVKVGLTVETSKYKVSAIKRTFYRGDSNFKIH